MSRCVFAPEARADLAEIHDYIARRSPDHAVQFVRRLEEHCFASQTILTPARPDRTSARSSASLPYPGLAMSSSIPLWMTASRYST